MSISFPVNGIVTPEAVCMPSLGRFQNQFLVMDRCAAISFEPLDCLTFIMQVNSLTIVGAYDDYAAARSAFETIHEFAPSLIELERKPLPFEDIRTVDVRDHCGGDYD